MPLPSSGPISAADINDELGNSSGTTVDFDNVFTGDFGLSRPHGMDELYGLSAGYNFTFPDWDGTVTITEFGVIYYSIGNAASVTINTSNFGAITTTTTQTVSVTITAPSTFNGQPVDNAGSPLTDDVSATQQAVGRYLDITAADASLDGDETSVSLTVTDTYYNSTNSKTPWEITVGPSVYDNQLGVVSFLPITGEGTQTTSVNLSENTSGETIGSSFTVTGTVGGKTDSVDVSQTSYTPVPEPTISIQSISPTGPYSYDGIAQITYTISKTDASSYIAQISPATDGNNAQFSEIQPGGITYTGPSYISGTTNTFYVEIPAREDTDTDTKNSYLTVSVSTIGGNDDDYDTIQQEGYSLPTYSWGGSVSIDRYTGDVVVSNDDSAGTISISPTSFNEYVTTSTPREVTISNIIIPSGYQNAGTAESLTFNLTQQAAARTLTATPSATEIGGGTTSILLDINDVYYTDTSWTLSEDFDNTISNLTFSPSSGTGDSPYTMISFGTNTSGGTKYGRFTLSGGDSLIEITITQTVYVAPPSISIDSVTPSGPYPYEGQVNIFVNISRSGGTNYSAQIAPSYNSVVAVFPELQPSGITWNNASSLTITTGTSFIVEVPSRSDGTLDTYSSQLSVNASNSGGGDSDSYTLEQVGLVNWETNPTSLSFGTLGGSQNITLNSSYSWTASVSGTGFSIDTTSGNSGTSTISVTATQKDLGGSGTLTFSASGQSDIVVSLSQAAAPLEYDWFFNGSNQSGNTISLTPSTISTSYSFGLYGYRGSTAVATTWMLQRTSGNWIDAATTTSGTTSFATTTSGQNTNGTPYLYLNIETNTGSARSGQAEITVDGILVAIIYVTQSGASSGGGGGGPDPGGIE